MIGISNAIDSGIKIGLVCRILDDTFKDFNSCFNICPALSQWFDFRLSYKEDSVKITLMFSSIIWYHFFLLYLQIEVSISFFQFYFGHFDRVNVAT